MRNYRGCWNDYSLIVLSIVQIEISLTIYTCVLILPLLKERNISQREIISISSRHFILIINMWNLPLNLFRNVLNSRKNGVGQTTARSRLSLVRKVHL